jgi:hypothetical protein
MVGTPRQQAEKPVSSRAEDVRSSMLGQQISAADLVRKINLFRH